MNRMLSFILLFIMVSCGQAVKAPVENASNPSALSECKSGQYDPQNIDQLLNMINSLPKPLELECILKSLKRPLYVNASASTMSVQPAVGTKSPRIFIFKGNLILTLVPAGEGSLVLEFSELKNDVRSIKGEIDIPVLSIFKKSDAFTKINNTNKTTCSGCHTSEQFEYQMDGVPVYSSKALKPSSTKNVPLQNLRNELYLCQSKNDSSRRCAILSSLLSHGPVSAKEFPADMPSLLDAFQ